MTPGTKRDIEAEGVLEIQDDWASLLADACMHLVAARLRRCLWLWRGLPVSMAALLGHEDVAAEALGFERQFAAYQEFSKQDGKTSSMREVLRRSPFNHTSVRQLAQASAMG